MAGKTKPSHCEYCGARLERLYSIKSAAVQFDLSQKFLRRLVENRTVGFVKVGRLIRLPESELVKLGEYFPSIESQVQKIFRDTKRVKAIRNADTLRHC